MTASLAARVATLASRVAELVPAEVDDDDDDDDIIDGIASGDLREHHLDALFEVVRPGLTASVLCAAAIIKPQLEDFSKTFFPIGVLDQVAIALSREYDWTGPAPWDAASMWVGWKEDPWDPTHWHVDDVRIALANRLIRERPLDLLRRDVDRLIEDESDEAIVPLMDEEETKRLLRLVAPLQPPRDHDLPIAVWKDATGMRHTSWHPRTGQNWTVVDKGGRPGWSLGADRPRWEDAKRGLD